MLLNLDRDEWFIALTFGVAIDADHLFAAPRYIADNGWGAILRPSWDDGSGIPWRSWLHYPIGFGLVAPLAIGWRLMIPLVFWALHVGMDELQAMTLTHSAAVESAVLIASSGSILALGYWRWQALNPDTGFRLYVRYLRDTLRETLTRRSRATP